MSRKSTMVLLVEDDVLLRQTLGDILSDEGFQVITAGNGREALDWLNSTHPLPRAIVTDLLMPHLDGWQLCEALSRNQNWRSIPILVLSTALHDRNWPEGIEPIHQMRKPPNLEHFLNILERLVADHPMPASA